jgi:hypothetical protein
MPAGQSRTSLFIFCEYLIENFATSHAPNEIPTILAFSIDSSSKTSLS